MKIFLIDPAGFDELLIRKGFTRRGLARASKIGYSTAIQICRGDRNPSPPVAKKIVDALDCNFDDVFKLVPSEQLQKDKSAV